MLSLYQVCSSLNVDVPITLHCCQARDPNLCKLFISVIVVESALHSHDRPWWLFLFVLHDVSFYYWYFTKRVVKVIKLLIPTEWSNHSVEKSTTNETIVSTRETQSRCERANHEPSSFCSPFMAGSFLCCDRQRCFSLPSSASCRFCLNVTDAARLSTTIRQAGKLARSVLIQRDQVMITTINRVSARRCNSWRLILFVCLMLTTWHALLFHVHVHKSYMYTRLRLTLLFIWGALNWSRYHVDDFSLDRTLRLAQA